jgi:hypothetical protein
VGFMDCLPINLLLSMRLHVTQTGSIFTVALRKLGTQWRLTAWAWAKGT